MRKIIYLTIVLVLLFASTSLGQSSEDCYRVANIFVSGYGSKLWRSQVQFSGIAWGLFAENEDMAQTLKRAVESWHGLGKVYIATMSFQTFLDVDSLFDRTTACLDVYGNPIEKHVDWSNAKYWHNINHPLVHKFLLDTVKRIIDSGADGVIVDESSFNVFATFEEPGGTFDEYSMHGFRTFLKQKYSTADVSRKFGIADIDSFNYRNWILENGLAEIWNRRPFDGLAAEFFLYQTKASRDFFGSFVDTAKNYTMSKYGRQFLISANTAGFHAATQFVLDLIDFNTNEIWYGNPDRLTAAIHQRMGWAVSNKPTLVLAEAEESSGPIPFEVVNMPKLILGDIVAARGIAIISEEIARTRPGYGYVRPGVKLDPVETNRYSQFILQNQSIFQNLRPLSKIALLYSHASIINNLYGHITSMTHMETQGLAAYWGMAKILFESNFQFDLVYAGDSRITDLPLQLNDMRRYECIVLPNTFSLSDEDVSKILQYLSEGGKLIASGNIGVLNEHCENVPRAELESLLIPGENIYGSGKLYYIPDDLGTEYYMHKTQSAKDGIDSAVLRYLTPRILISGSDKLRAFAYRDTINHYVIINLVNYDFDSVADVFLPFDGLTISIEAGEVATSSKAYLISPDFQESKALSSKKIEDYLQFDIPKFEAYAIMIVGQNSLPPTFSSYFPTTDTTVTAGDSLFFSVSANDPEGGPLFYHWYVNCVRDSTTLGRQHKFTTQVTDSARIDSIMVVVSDGYYEVGYSWIVAIEEYVFPRILYDESHDPYNTLSWEKALENDNSNPREYNKAYMGYFSEAVQERFRLTRNDSLEFTSDLLSDFDILILPAGIRKALSTSEIESVLDFVSEGGNLLVFSHWDFKYLNPLTSSFGIQFESTVLADESSNVNFNITEFPIQHEIFNNVRKIHFNVGTCLKLSEDAQPVVYMPSNCYRDDNFNNMRDVDEASGPFVVLATAEYGKGNVVCYADNSFADGWSFWEFNKNLMMGILSWLAPKSEDVTSVKDNLHNSALPTSFRLYQNSPNPFNSSTAIKYQLPKPSHVRIEIFNIIGQKIATIVDRKQNAGYSIVHWDGKDTRGQSVGSGVYFIKMSTDAFTQSNKILLLK